MLWHTPSIPSASPVLLPFELLIGLRYTHAKRRNHFISFISIVSMAGIALGVDLDSVGLEPLEERSHEFAVRAEDRVRPSLVSVAEQQLD